MDFLKDNSKLIMFSESQRLTDWKETDLNWFNQQSLSWYFVKIVKSEISQPWEQEGGIKLVHDQKMGDTKLPLKFDSDVN